MAISSANLGSNPLPSLHPILIRSIRTSGRAGVIRHTLHHRRHIISLVGQPHPLQGALRCSRTAHDEEANLTHALSWSLRPAGRLLTS